MHKILGRCQDAGRKGRTSPSGAAVSHFTSPPALKGHGVYCPCLSGIRHADTWHLLKGLSKEVRSSQKKQHKSPYSESCCEALHLRNGVFYFEKTLIRYTKEGERTWIRLKSDFNIRHLAAAPALALQITAIDDALRCPLEREHRIP